MNNNNYIVIGGNKYGLPTQTLIGGKNNVAVISQNGGGVYKNNVAVISQNEECSCNVINASIFEKMFNKITNGTFFTNANNKTKRKSFSYK